MEKRQYQRCEIRDGERLRDSVMEIGLMSDLGMGMKAEPVFRVQGARVGSHTRIVMAAVSGFLKIRATGTQDRGANPSEVQISGSSRIASVLVINLKSGMCVK